MVFGTKSFEEISFKLNTCCFCWELLWSFEFFSCSYINDLFSNSWSYCLSKSLFFWMRWFRFILFGCEPTPLPSLSGLCGLSFIGRIVELIDFSPRSYFLSIILIKLLLYSLNFLCFSLFRDLSKGCFTSS